MASPPLLAARHLTVVRGQRRLLDDVSISVEVGEILALVGPNGAGKSTLMKALAGILPYQGEIFLEGSPAETLPRRMRARHLAYVPQHSTLDAPMLAREVVSQGRFAHRDGWGRASGDDAAAIAAALAATEATHLADRPFSRLSYGERRLVLLARALATGARILLLDEPTAALDAEAEHAVFQRFRALAQGRTTILISHRFPTVRMADRIVVLEGGTIIEQGTHAELLAAGARYARLFALQAEGYR